MKQNYAFCPLIRSKLLSLAGATIMTLVFTAMSIHAQSVKGIVKSNTNEEIIGATVFVKGTTRGVITGALGDYTIECAPNETLVFSFIGYTTREIIVGNEKVIDVVLEESAVALSEVVVVGYGVQKKEGVVASVTQTTNK
ncbi:MAG TPA: carboxypeptidase-like regulatory domain-containing protein, partial [Saprospiraceae bacterium]|nr:carboxypeptidase-like regulatory domain-containing protein [Saprospiraceae bacterium]